MLFLYAHTFEFNGHGVCVYVCTCYTLDCTVLFALFSGAGSAATRGLIILFYSLSEAASLLLNYHRNCAAERVHLYIFGSFSRAAPELLTIKT
jgi:hypothetical protein